MALCGEASPQLMKSAADMFKLETAGATLALLSDAASVKHDKPIWPHLPSE